MFNSRLFFLVIFSIALISAVAVSSLEPAEAKRSQGVASSVILSKQVCGDRLCEAGEELTTEEKIGYYLLSFVEVPESTLAQQSMMGMGGMSSGGSMGLGFGGNSIMDRGFTASFGVPTISGTPQASASAPQASAPQGSLQVSPLARAAPGGLATEDGEEPQTRGAPMIRATPGGMGVGALKERIEVGSPAVGSFGTRDMGSVASLQIRSAGVDKLAGMIEKTGVIQGKIDRGQLKIGKDLGFDFDRKNVMALKIAQEEQAKLKPTLKSKLQLDTGKPGLKVLEKNPFQRLGSIPSVNLFQPSSDPISSDVLSFNSKCYGPDEIAVIVVRDISLFSDEPDIHGNRIIGSPNILVASTNLPQNTRSLDAVHYSSPDGNYMINSWDGEIDDPNSDGTFIATMRIDDLGAIGRDTYTATYTNEQSGVSGTATAFILGDGAPQELCVDDNEAGENFRPKIVLSLTPVEDSKVRLEFTNQNGDWLCRPQLGDAPIGGGQRTYVVEENSQFCFGSINTSLEGWEPFHAPIFAGDVITILPYDRLYTGPGSEFDYDYDLEAYNGENPNYVEYTDYTELSTALTIRAELTEYIVGDSNQYPTIEVNGDSYRRSAYDDQPEIIVTFYAANTRAEMRDNIEAEISWTSYVETYDHSVSAWKTLTLMETDGNTGIFTKTLGNPNYFSNNFGELIDVGEEITIKILDKDGLMNAPGGIIDTITIPVTE